MKFEDIVTFPYAEYDAICSKTCRPYKKRTSLTPHLWSQVGASYHRFNANISGPFTYQ